MAGNRPTARDRRSMDVGTCSTGQQGHQPREQVVEEFTATRDEEQSEDPLRQEPATATRNVEEA